MRVWQRSGCFKYPLASSDEIFPGRSLSARLDEAFARFKSWCRDNGKSTSIKEFSKKSLKIEKQLSYAFLSKFSLNVDDCPSKSLPVNLAPDHWRPGNWPCGAGKAFDTSLVASWLEDELEKQDPATPLAFGLHLISPMLKL